MDKYILDKIDFDTNFFRVSKKIVFLDSNYQPTGENAHGTIIIQMFFYLYILLTILYPKKTKIIIFL